MATSTLGLVRQQLAAAATQLRRAPGISPQRVLATAVSRTLETSMRTSSLLTRTCVVAMAAPPSRGHTRSANAWRSMDVAAHARRRLSAEATGATMPLMLLTLVLVRMMMTAVVRKGAGHSSLAALFNEERKSMCSGSGSGSSSSSTIFKGVDAWRPMSAAEAHVRRRRRVERTGTTLPRMLVTLVLLWMKPLAAAWKEVELAHVTAYFIVQWKGVTIIKGVIGSGFMLIGVGVIGHFPTSPSDLGTVTMIEGVKGMAQAGCDFPCLPRCVDFLHGRPWNANRTTTQPNLGRTARRHAALASSLME